MATTTPTNATVERVRQSGTGHQLIIPYFNVQNGNSTLVDLVNTDMTNGKAVKVRFRGGSNSDDVFDFQVFLSPGDVWSANLSRGPNGVTRLTSSDKSCTLPSGVGAGSAGSDFVTARLPATLTGDALASETREGYIEIFNMADIPPFKPDTAAATLGAVTATANALFTAIKHVAGTPPCTAATMNTLATDPATLTAAYNLGFRAPTASLFANWTIINVPKAGSATGEALAITASQVIGGAQFPANGNIVFFPQTGAAATAPIDFYTADPSLRTTAGVAVGDVQNGAGLAYAGGPTPIIAGSMFDLPDLSTPYLLLAAYPPVYVDPLFYILNLQNALATASVTNEFLTEPGINAFTDWTFSQPTRRYAVAPDYRPLLTTPAGTLGRAFVNNNFYSLASTAVNAAPKAYQICAATTGVTFFDREEFTAVGNNFVISPNPPAPVFRLCGETSVLTFNAATGSSVLGAEIAKTNLSTPGTSGTVNSGWAVVGTPGPFAQGLPIVGKAFVSAFTGTLNVGGSWEHRYVPTFP